MPAFLFDFNGVLVDDEPVHFAAFADVVAAHGITLARDDYFARYLAFDDATAFRAIFRDAGKPADDATIAACVREKSPRYFARVENALVFFPGAFALLESCAAAGDVAIVSGAAREEIDFALKKANAAARVKRIVAAEDVAACKPDPSGYREAVRRLGVDPRSAIAIEDSIAGVEAAIAAGCRVAAVAHSYPKAKLVEANAHLVVEAIADLDVASLTRVLA